MPVTADIRMIASGNWTSALDLGTASFPIDINVLSQLTNGTGANQVTKVYQDSVTLAGSASQNYDLDDAAQVLAIGTGAFARIVAIMLWRTDSGDEIVSVGGDFILSKLLAGWVDDTITIPLRPGGRILYVSPDATATAITASTGDVITLTNASSSDSVTVKVLILGS